MQRLLLVCLGGALGSGARYGISLLAAAKLGTTFPYGTLIANVAGCFLISLLMHAAGALTLPGGLLLFLTTGFLGGLTTFSTFNYEATTLFEEGALRIGLANIVITLVGCTAATISGLVIARGLVGAAAVSR